MFDIAEMKVTEKRSEKQKVHAKKPARLSDKISIRWNIVDNLYEAGWYF